MRVRCSTTLVCTISRMYIQTSGRSISSACLSEFDCICRHGDRDCAAERLGSRRVFKLQAQRRATDRGEKRRG
ncbi:uncharacterized protein C8Q71DRAFT_908732 [Rhodofomes roseus]|uniref:Secreted protein n=1 Tax=Rhodofomes roseus TaxID=34475 RepID=A0ABQ8KBF9_9APHY|nr:uncharacterized protein C8Q71DRAFT_908732 [Rhodofomes roseus]KAH9834892.1 hypothetical protein C8Q71DRAFT_908732 [Rhodofomes roseus]